MKSITTILILLILLVAPSSFADHAGDVLALFLARTGDPSVAQAKFDSADFVSWLEMAQNKVSSLTGDIEKTVNELYSKATPNYNMPIGFKSMKKVLIYSDSSWYAIGPYGYDSTQPGVGYLVSWTGADSAIVRLMIGGVIPKQTHVLFDDDSAHYRMPIDFRQPIGIMHRSGSDWLSVVIDPFFQRDTTAMRAMFAPVGNDNVEMYLRGQYAYDGDTVRVWYLGGPTTGDSLKIEYYSKPSAVTAMTDTVEVSASEYVELVDEIMSYYLQSMRAFDVAAGVQKATREDITATEQREIR